MWTSFEAIIHLPHQFQVYQMTAFWSVLENKKWLGWRLSSQGFLFRKLMSQLLGKGGEGLPRLPQHSASVSSTLDQAWGLPLNS